MSEALKWFNANYEFRHIDEYIPSKIYKGSKKIYWYPSIGYLTQEKIEEIAKFYYEYAHRKY